MKASKIRTIWIMFLCGMQMAKIISQGVFYGLRGKLTRELTDKCMHDWAKRMMKILKIDYKLVNPNQLNFADGKRYVIMVNHSSLYDIPICYATLPGSIRMIAKKELFKIPFFGYAMRAAEVPAIDRQNRQQAIKDLQYAREKMQSGLIIWIAPEGTRSEDGKVKRLKKGGFIMALEAGAHIVPVGIRGANEILPKKTWQFHLGKKVEVHVGTPIDTSDYSLETKENLIQRVSGELKELADAH